LNLSKSIVNGGSGGKLVLDQNVRLFVHTGGIDFGGSTVCEIRGEFYIGIQGFVNPNSPSYTSTSVLKYMTGGSYDVKVEWNDSNVDSIYIGNNTVLNVGLAAPAYQRNITGNIEVSSGSELTLNAMTTFLGINGNLRNNGTVTLSSASQGDLKITGNLINNGTFNCNNRAVFFNGSAPQTFSGSSSNTTIDFLFMQNSSSTGLVLAQHLFVDDTLNFTDGIIYSTASALLTFNANAEVSRSSSGAASNNSHVNGVVRKITSGNSFVFPIGKNGRYRPAGISSVGAGSTTHFDAEYFPASPSTAGYSHLLFESPLIRVSNIEYWMLDRSTGDRSARVMLSWDTSSGIQSSTSLLVARWDAGVSKWQSRGRSGGFTGSSTSGTITSDVVSTFSPFTLSTDQNNNTLPVELIDFQAEEEGEKRVRVTWQTASEIENDYFVVEKSKDGKVFDAVGTVKGAGNSTQILEYILYDDEPYGGTSYYRLKIVAFDGSFEYSRVEVVHFDAAQPSGDLHTDLFQNLPDGEYFMQVFDASGKEINACYVVVKEKVAMNPINFGYLPQGMYLVRIFAPSNIRVKKLLKQ
jgi:hypothetical protein